MPEQLYFRDAQLIEETNDYVVVRMEANMHATSFGGGLAFAHSQADVRGGGETLERQAFFIGRPQQTFWAIATLPHFPQRNPAIRPPTAVR